MKRDFLLLASIRLIPLIVNVLKISDRCWSRWWRVIFGWAWTSPRVFSPFFLDRHAARCRPSVGDRKTLKGKICIIHTCEKNWTNWKWKIHFSWNYLARTNQTQTHALFSPFRAQLKGGFFFQFREFLFQIFEKSRNCFEQTSNNAKVRWERCKNNRATESPAKLAILVFNASLFSETIIDSRESFFG